MNEEDIEKYHLDDADKRDYLQLKEHLKDLSKYDDLTYFDKEGRPISKELFHVLFIKDDYQIVKQDKIKKKNGEILVSTVWLGLNHRFFKQSDDDLPIIFETMVFEDGLPTEQDMDRYSTLQEALEGHERMLNKVIQENASQKEEET